MRYIEYNIVLGDSPPGVLIDDIKEIANPIEDDRYDDYDDEEGGSVLFPETVIHHLTKDNYVWNFSLIYREGNFDVIKWKTAFSWKQKKEAEEAEEQEKEAPLMNKALFIGASAGVFFIKLDENIYDNFNLLADMMDVFIEKTKSQAPFIVYALLEDKKAIVELKQNKDKLKHLADVKKWTAQNGGIFKLDTLSEIKMNITHLIQEYSHTILTHLEGKTTYPDLKLGEVHYLDYHDLTTLKEIERALQKQAKAGQTVDHLLSELFFEFLEQPEVKEEKIEPEEVSEEDISVQEEGKEEIAIDADVTKLSASKIKIVLEQIRKGIRRQCPKCFNHDRNKIREAIDWNHLIMQNPNIYGFKYVCGMCGHEWRTE